VTSLERDALRREHIGRLKRPAQLKGLNPF
jgi:hypothetical protein